MVRIQEIHNSFILRKFDQSLNFDVGLSWDWLVRCFFHNDMDENRFMVRWLPHNPNILNRMWFTVLSCRHFDNPGRKICLPQLGVSGGRFGHSRLYLSLRRPSSQMQGDSELHGKLQAHTAEGDWHCEPVWLIRFVFIHKPFLEITKYFLFLCVVRKNAAVFNI